MAMASSSSSSSLATCRVAPISGWREWYKQNEPLIASVGRSLRTKDDYNQLTWSVGEMLDVMGFGSCEQSYLARPASILFSSRPPQYTVPHPLLQQCVDKRQPYFCCVEYSDGTHGCNLMPVMIGSGLDLYLLEGLCSSDQYDLSDKLFCEIDGTYYSCGGQHLIPHLMINRREMVHHNRLGKPRPSTMAQQGALVYLYDRDSRGHCISTHSSVGGANVGKGGGIDGGSDGGGKIFVGHCNQPTGVLPWKAKEDSKTATNGGEGSCSQRQYVLYRNRNAVSVAYPFGTSFTLDAEFELDHEDMNMRAIGWVMEMVLRHKFPIDNLVNKFVYSPTSILAAVLQRARNVDQHAQIFTQLNNGQLEKFRSQRAEYESSTNQHRNVVNRRHHGHQVRGLMRVTPASSGPTVPSSPLPSATTATATATATATTTASATEETSPATGKGTMKRKRCRTSAPASGGKSSSRVQGRQGQTSQQQRGKSGSNLLSSAAASAETRGQTIRTLSFNMIANNPTVDQISVRPMLGTVPRSQIPTDTQYFFDRGFISIKVDKHFRWLQLLANVFSTDRLKYLWYAPLRVLLGRLVQLGVVERVLSSLRPSGPEDVRGLVLINGAIPTYLRVRDSLAGRTIPLSVVCELKRLNPYVEVWSVSDEFLMLNLTEGILMVPLEVEDETGVKHSVFASPLELATIFRQWTDQLNAENLFGRQTCQPQMRNNINDLCVSKLSAIAASSNRLTSFDTARYFTLSIDVFGTYIREVDFGATPKRWTRDNSDNVATATDRENNLRGDGKRGYFNSTRNQLAVRQVFTTMPQIQGDCYVVSDRLRSNVVEVFRSRFEIECNLSAVNLTLYRVGQETTDTNCSRYIYDYHPDGRPCAVSIVLATIEYNADTTPRRPVRMNHQTLTRTRIYCIPENALDGRVRLLLVRRIDLEPNSVLNGAYLTVAMVTTRINTCSILFDLLLEMSYGDHFSGLKLGEQCGQKGICVRANLDGIPERPNVLASYFSISSRQSLVQLKQMFVNQMATARWRKLGEWASDLCGPIPPSPPPSQPSSMHSGENRVKIGPLCTPRLLRRYDPNSKRWLSYNPALLTGPLAYNIQRNNSSQQVRGRSKIDTTFANVVACHNSHSLYDMTRQMRSYVSLPSLLQQIVMLHVVIRLSDGFGGEFSSLNVGTFEQAQQALVGTTSGSAMSMVNETVASVKRKINSAKTK